MNPFKKAIAILIILLIIILAVLETVSLSSQDVTLSVIPAIPIDLVLTQTDKSINTTTFEEDVKAKLNTLGIDTSNTDMINISTIETTETKFDAKASDATTIFNSWYKLPTLDNHYTLRGIYITNSVYSNFDSSANDDTSNAFNQAIINPDTWESTSVSISGKIFVHGCGWGSGVILKYNKATDIAYIVMFDKNGNDDTALYKVTNYSQITHSSSTNIEGYSGSSLLTYAHCDVAEGGKYDSGVDYTPFTCSYDGETGIVKVIQNGSTIISYNIGKDIVGGVGLHAGCCVAYTDIVTTSKVEIVKEYSDVLAEPNWRDDAYHFIVNVDNTTTMFTNGSTRAAVLSRTMNDDIHFIDWGTSSTKTYVDDFIKDNDNKGTFTLSSNYNQAIEDTANYIYSVVKRNVDSEYVLVNELTNINVNPSELKTNTATTDYPNGKWYIHHDYTYYENNLGLSAQTENYKSDLICSFDKPGKYDIYFADKLIKTIYAHRAPVALFNIGLNGSAITLTSTSYDLDEQSKGTNGIKTEKWSYMLSDASGNSTWYEGKPTTFDNTKVYLIKLEVEDYQGATAYTTKYLGTGNPVAAFNVAAVTSKYATLQITDTSYDPEGYTITGWNWVLKKNGTQVATYTTQIPNTNFNTSALGVGTYQYILTVTNSKGTTSETYTKTFTIIDDEIKPEVLINPTNCDWRTGTQPIEVKVSDSDSGLKNWQYAFTDSQTTPTSGWSEEQTNGNTTINTPSTTGEYYLHIKATDNAGNILNRALGVYKIDNTEPIINIIGDTTTTKIDSVTIKVSSTDRLSGVKIFTVNGQKIENGNVTFIKNGTYTFYAEDNAGKSATEVLEIKNIYYECNAGLNHPIYSSDYDSCPICESFKGLSVTNTTNVYDGQGNRVQYDNPKNATIVEYYNGTNTLQNKVGTYEYELKVVYGGTEYETGIKGTYTITQKDITITDITSPDKTYDGTDEMTVTGGRLEGVCDGDTVSFTLPSAAYAENKNVGKHKIRLGSDIVLTGVDADNYNLIQPTYGSITSNILKKVIKTEGIQGKTKKYDKTKIVEIIGGSIVNGISGDDISLNIPKTGTSESANTGNWKVTIDDVVLEGEDAKNYTLEQPEEVRVTIEKADGSLTIGCDSKVYDRSVIVPYVVNNNSTSEVTYKYYKTGTDEEIEAPKNVGKYDVIGIIESDGNYTEVTTEKVAFEITPKDITITDITSPDKTYDGTDEMTVTGGKLEGVCDGDTVSFILPSEAYAENKNVGKHKIRLESDIVLTGADVDNYNLIQPTYGSITSNILKKVIKTEGIQGKTKKYDKTKIVEIIGGSIVNGISGDDISLNIPKTGTSESANTGNWKVQIEDVKLEGADANNYELEQLEEVRVTIEKVDVVLIIGCDEKKFDRKPIKAYVVSNNSPLEVAFKYYKAGTDEEVENPTDIGIYEVVGIIEEDENYTAATSERVKVEISKPDEPNLKVDSKIIELNNKEIESTKEIDIHYQDTIKIKIEVKNEGIGSGYLAKVLTELPTGTEFIENSEINKKFGWKINNGKLETTLYSFEENFEAELEGISEEGETEDKIELELELKIITTDRENKQMKFPFEIEQQDKHGDKIEYKEENEENSKDEFISNVKYFDVSIDKKITSLTLTYIDTGKEETFDIEQRKGSALKMEISEKRANTSFAKLKYKITLENKGNESGVVNQIVDLIPKGTTFDTADNPNWKIDSSGNAVYKEAIELNEGEKKELELILRWDLRNYNLGTRKNQVFFEAEKEIDQILIEEKKLSINDSDNIDSSEMVFSLPTGSNSITYAIIGITVAAIFGIGVYYIKKRVI